MLPRAEEGAVGGEVVGGEAEEGEEEGAGEEEVGEEEVEAEDQAGARTAATTASICQWNQPTPQFH